MKFISQLNLRQRYNIGVFAAIAIASCLLVGSMYVAMSTYAYEYSSHYWQNYTNTFSDSASYPIIVDSANGGEVIARNLESDINILRASIFNAKNGTPF